MSDEEQGQTDAGEGTTSDSGEATTDNQTDSQDSSQGSETQTNSEDGGESQGKKMIPIPADKWREANRTIRDLQAKVAEHENPGKATDTGSTETGEEGEENPVDQRAVKQIAEAVRQELAPTLSILEQSERKEAFKELAQKSYLDELKGEIAELLVSPDLKKLPIRERVQRAYEIAAGRNIDKLVGGTAKKAGEDGYNAAYEKINEKKSGESVDSGASTRRASGSHFDTWKEMESGTAKDAYYEKHRQEIFKEQGLGTPD